MAWVDVGIVPPGPRGDRFVLTAQREPPNSYSTLYQQRQVWNVDTGTYNNVGEMEALTTLYDGWINVGFWLPSMVDNGNGTITFSREWWCRVDGQSNNFLPGGLVEEMGTATLPQGPQGYPGGYYAISSSNPAAHVANFYRRFFQWSEEANNGAGGWVPAGEYELFGGVVAPAGPRGFKGDMFTLQAINPPGQPHIVEIWAQQIDGESGDPIGDPVYIGQAVAVQGAQGPPGIQGPPGGVTGWTPSDEWLQVEEWDRLHWIAYKFTGWVAEVLTKQIAYEQVGVAGALVGAGAMAALAGFAIGGPPGAAAGFILGVGAEVIGVIGSLNAEIWLEHYQIEANRRAIADGVYCSLINYRGLSLAELEAWTSLYEYPDPIYWLNQNDPVRCTQAAIANHWREIGMVEAQKEIALYTLQFSYDPSFNPQGLGCTPNTGGGQDQWDFTTGQHGWEIFTPYGSFGAYVPGTGWVGTERPNEGDVVGIKLDVAQLGVLHVEVLYDLDAVGGVAGVHFGDVTNGNFSYQPAPVPGVNMVWSRDFGGGQDMAGFVLWFSTWAFDAGLVVKRISITRL